MRNRTLLFLVLLLVAGLAFAGGRQEREDEATDQDPAQDVNTESAEEPESDSQPGTRIGSNDPGRSVATINGVGILREDYENAVEQTRMRFAQQGQQISETDLQQFRVEILDQLIAEELLYQEALRQGLEAGQDTVDSQYQQMRSQFETDEQWQQALQANNTTEAELRDQIARNSLIQKLIQTAVADMPAVTDEEVRSFYDDNPELFQQGEQIAARHILISTQELEGAAAIEEARDRAEAIRQELLNGSDFATLAQERSEGPSGPQGGELGTFGRGQMVAPFEEAAFALDEGELSQVVETQFGFHIIQVTEKIDGGTVPFEQVSANIRQYLAQQKQADALAAYVAELREEADVEVNS